MRGMTVMVVLCVLQLLALAHTDKAESCAGLQLDSEEDLVQRCLDRLPVEEAESCLVRLENHLITVDIIRAGVTADYLAGELGFTARECDAVLLNDAAWRSKYESGGEPAPVMPPSEEWDLHRFLQSMTQQDNPTAIIADLLSEARPVEFSSDLDFCKFLADHLSRLRQLLQRESFVSELAAGLQRKMLQLLGSEDEVAGVSSGEAESEDWKKLDWSRSKSQGREEHFAWTTFFWGKRQGTFLELGALDGAWFSNTLGTRVC